MGTPVFAYFPIQLMLMPDKTTFSTHIVKFLNVLIIFILFIYFLLPDPLNFY